MVPLDLALSSDRGSRTNTVRMAREVSGDGSEPIISKCGRPLSVPVVFIRFQDQSSLLRRQPSFDSSGPEAGAALRLIDRSTMSFMWTIAGTNAATAEEISMTPQ